jgi:hypothetical protein
MMKIYTTALSLLLLLLNLNSFSQEVNENNWQNGDLVFIKDPKMANTLTSSNKEKFNCVGILFVEGGHPYVYYVSSGPLKKISFHEFIEQSESKKYSIKWLAESSVLTESAINTMHTFANAKIGTAFDAKENLNSEDLYSAEFVWKIYKSGTGTHLCEPKDMSGEPNNKSANKKLENKYVSVRDIYKSELLE